jgi:hypothetical protein
MNINWIEDTLRMISSDLPGRSGLSTYRRARGGGLQRVKEGIDSAIAEIVRMRKEAERQRAAAEAKAATSDEVSSDPDPLF